MRIPTEHAIVDEDGCERTSEGFRQRGQTENRVGSHRRAATCVRVANAALQKHLVVLNDGNGKPGYLAAIRELETALYLKAA